mgnify:CR=1 FL=1
MPGLMVTRGLGGSATHLVVRGFLPTLRRIIKGGSRFAERAVAELEESLKISVMLLSANGKELAKPIVNNISRVFKGTNDIVVRALPKTLKRRKSERIKVTANLKDEKDE